MAGENRLAPQPLTPEPAAPAPNAAFAGLAASLRQTADDAARDALFFRLNQEPWSFNFYQAVRRLECAHLQLPRLGCSQRPSDDPVRFGQEPTLAFPPATVSRFDLPSPDSPARMYVNFLGLLGPHGPLPLHITEYVRDRQLNQNDPTLACFLNLLNHRMVSLFYRAWAVNQQTVSFDRAGGQQASLADRFALYVGALFGIAMESYRQRDAAPDVAKLQYSGPLVNQTRHAEGLRAMIADYFGLETHLDQFVGQWIDLPADSRCRLGESRDTGLLGSTAIVGSRIWQCQYKFRLRMGPMDFTAYQRLLPGGRSLRRLVAWVRNYIGAELAWDVQLTLKKEEVPRAKLGAGGSARLGWSTWLKSQPTPRDPDDLILNPGGSYADN